MLSELEPVWKQLVETYDALREALEELPDDRLDWKAGPEVPSAGEMAQHIGRGNISYSHMMQYGERRARPEIVPGIPRAEIMERLQTSLGRVQSVFEMLPPDRLHAPCADEWQPLGEAAVPGPLDALWFALQMVRHTAYHLGQINMISLLLEDEAGNTA